MPRANQRCRYDCSNTKGKCKEHAPQRIPWENKRERQFLKTAKWKRQVRRVLFRDNDDGGCRLKFEGCTHLATQVDHILPVWYTGKEEVEDDNLQGVCEPCHRKKSSFEGVQAKRIKRGLV